MLIHFASAATYADRLDPCFWFKVLALRDRFKVHSATDDPECADVILFVDNNFLDTHLGQWHLKSLRAHPLVRRFPEKIFVFDQRDYSWDSFPGIYLNLPRHNFDTRRQRAYSYPLFDDEKHQGPETRDPDLLFSFVGMVSHRCRRPLLQLQHERAIVSESKINFFQDTAKQPADYSQQLGSQRAIFEELMARSKFVLCPRGYGASSIRLYETLRAGRVPVIISDDWVEPRDPDWSTFSLRITESNFQNIPALLEAREADYLELSRNARAAYENWFADDVYFHRIAEALGELLQNGACTRRSAASQVKTARSFIRCGARVQYIGLRKKLGSLKRGLLSHS